MRDASEKLHVQATMTLFFGFLPTVCGTSPSHAASAGTVISPATFRQTGTICAALAGSCARARARSVGGSLLVKILRRSRRPACGHSDAFVSTRGHAHASCIFNRTASKRNGIRYELPYPSRRYDARIDNVRREISITRASLRSVPILFFSIFFSTSLRYIPPRSTIYGETYV